MSKIPLANGNVLHDWHAEVLALRAFNHFILEECKAVLAEGKQSPFLHLRTGADLSTKHGGYDPPFAWRDGVSLHMYCSEVPCGDASMELTISAQEDDTPWEAPLSRHMMERSGLQPSTTPSSSSSALAATPDLLLLGRACFSHLGVVRRKPGRADAPPTLSKSCSDKLALKQCTSLLGSVTSLLVSPRGVYLESLVMPESQFSETACERCFSPRGRMAGVDGVEGGWGEGYEFRPFEVKTTSLDFAYSRQGGKQGVGETRYVPSNIATAWNSNGLLENTIGGVMQGRKQTDPRGGSAVCRRRMWSLARDIARLLGAEDAVPKDETYAALKETRRLADRRLVKEVLRAEALKGWVRNSGDEGFGLAI